MTRIGYGSHPFFFAVRRFQSQFHRPASRYRSSSETNGSAPRVLNPNGPAPFFTPVSVETRRTSTKCAPGGEATQMLPFIIALRRWGYGAKCDAGGERGCFLQPSGADVWCMCDVQAIDIVHVCSRGQACDAECDALSRHDRHAQGCDRSWRSTVNRTFSQPFQYLAEYCVQVWSELASMP